MNNYKGLRIAILVLFLLVLVLVFAGAITMFFDVGEYHSWGYYGGYYYTSNPEAGIMPLFGFVLALVGFILFLVSKKKKNLLIGTIVLLPIAEILVDTSIIITEGYLGYAGYFVCVSGMSIAFVVWILAIVLLVLMGKKPKAKVETKRVQSEAKMDVFTELRKLKELYDMGVFTQEEYEQEKSKVLRRM